MASSVSAAVAVTQAVKRTHAEMEMSNNESSSPAVQDMQPSLTQTSNSTSVLTNTSAPNIPKATSPSNETTEATTKVAAAGAASATADSKPVAETNTSNDKDTVKHNNEQAPSGETKTVSSDPSAASHNSKSNSVSNSFGSKVDESEVPAIKSENSAAISETPKSPSSNQSIEASSATAVETNGASNATETEHTSTTKPADSHLPSNSDASSSEAKATAVNTSTDDTKPGSSKSQLEDGEEPEKKAKLSSTSGGKTSGKSPDQVLEYMDKTFDQRRKIITKQMPAIPELKKMYPDLFMGKQLLLEFQRITTIDIDQKVQEFCVRFATAVIEMARNKKGAAPVLARWEQAKQETETLKQYWDMVTALCLLPLHFGENFVEMVLEIGEDEEVKAQGKIVPTLVARGNIFRTDEFFLIAENTIVQEFEEFTIAFASLYSSYWVFNMVYPETIENTYNYIQRCIVRQREPGAIPAVCKNFTKSLQKWNKAKKGK